MTPCKPCCVRARPCAACCVMTKCANCSRIRPTRSNPPPWCRWSFRVVRACLPSAASTSSTSAARWAPFSSAISATCWPGVWPIPCAMHDVSKHVAPELSATLGEPMAAFARHLGSERRLSAHTLSNYLRDLNQAALQLQQRGLSSWSAVTPHEVRALVANWHRRGKGGTTIQRMLSSLRTFYGFLLREGLATDNPADGVRAPKSGKRLPKTLDQEQVAALLDRSSGEDDPLELRDQAMMELIYSS